MSYGNASVIGIAMQNSFGTLAAAGSLHHIPILNEDFGLKQEELLSQNLNGRFDEGDSYSGKRQYGGTLQSEAQPKMLGVLMTAAINDATVVTSASLRTYTFAPRTSDWDRYSPNRPFTYHKSLNEAASNSAQLFYDLCGGAFGLQLSEGGFLIARMGGIGGKAAAVGSSAAVVPTADSGRRWPWNQSSVSLGGVAIGVIPEFNLEYDEGINPRFFLDGTLTAGRIRRESARRIRISGTMLFESQSELNAFKNETQQTLVITLQDTTTAIQSGYYNTLQISIPSFYYVDAQVPVRGPNANELTFQGRGVYNAGSGHTGRFTLTNTYAAGY